MTLVRAGSLLLVLLFAATALAGCHGLDGDDPDADPSPTPTSTGNATATPTPTSTPTGSPSPTPTPEPGPSFSIVLLDVPDNVTRGDRVTINVSVEGDNITASTADLYFAYNSTVPITDENLTTSDFNGSVEGNGNTTFPGQYSIVNWTIDEERSLFVRAHLVYQGDHYWSDEEIITVNEPDDEEPVGKTTAIPIDTMPPEFPCALANYQGNRGPIAPSTTRIAAGEAVVWISGETAEDCVHTATSTDDPPLFDTGDIQNGETTAPVQFLEPGTYEYACSYHPAMTGTIEVQ